MLNNFKDTCWLGTMIDYDKLSGKEQESFNSTKLRAAMSDWGYLESFIVNGDKWGPDILFYKSSDATIMKVQLKGRPFLDRHYCEKDIHIAFQDRENSEWYVYPHDDIMAKVLATGRLVGTKSWDIKGSWSWSYIPPWLGDILNPWKIS
jgi:hypothetical protein